MVLGELGNKITSALSKLDGSSLLTDQAVSDMIKEICNALVAADVNVKLVFNLRENIKTRIKLDAIPAGIDKRKYIRKVVFEELCKMLDPGVEPWKPVRGKQNIIMFVGLQGSGKTTTVAKLAYYYKKAGWRPCMICADTFRAGALPQMKQNAALAGVSFYGSETERDPVKLATDGVAHFKNLGFDIIIVDTSGRNKQDEALFEEIEQVDRAIKPDNIIFVMDGSIGQAAHDQAIAFKERVKITSVIISKLDGHAKGGGALSAVVATKSPIIFYGTGEHLPDLQLFETDTFVSSLLGMGNLKELARLMKDIVPEKKSIVDITKKGKITLRDMYEQFEAVLKMGPLGKVMEMIPGLSSLPQGPNGADLGQAKLKSYMTIMDSMTDEELDDPKIINNNRCLRIARGSGRSLRDINELLLQYKTFSKLVPTCLNPRVSRTGFFISKIRINQLTKY
jgi:signal recognition particle subunit SRP54